MLEVHHVTPQGSRNGHAPIYMWYTLTRKGYEGMRKDVQKCLRNAHLLKVCLCLQMSLPRFITIACFSTSGFLSGCVICPDCMAVGCNVAEPGD